MNWRLIVKPDEWPAGGNRYNSPSWKVALAEEAHFQCVYCAIHERWLGGFRVFHVDHYRPKSAFECLIHDYDNLFYACPVCNVYKGNDWPREPENDHSVPAYPNPSVVNFSDLFEVFPDGTVAGKHPDAIYVAYRLHLNRPQLIRVRRFLNIKRRFHVANGSMRVLLERLRQGSEPNGIWEDLLGLMQRASELYDQFQDAEASRPYEPDDLSER